MQITQIDVYYRKSKDAELERSTAIPESQDIRMIKVQVGRMIKAIPYITGTYYVVIGAQKADGKVGYRTMIPKTVIG